MNCTKCGHAVKTLKVGDRVEAIGEVAGVNLEGRRGVVKKVTGDPDAPVLVRFDEPFLQGHDGLGNGMCERRGRWGRHKEFKLIAAGKEGVK